MTFAAVLAVVLVAIYERPDGPTSQCLEMAQHILPGMQAEAATTFEHLTKETRRS
jgi:hypothetical protein